MPRATVAIRRLKFGVRSSENLELRTSTLPSRSARLSRAAILREYFEPNARSSVRRMNSSNMSNLEQITVCQLDRFNLNLHTNERVSIHRRKL
jgi:hypothetical protein